MNRDEDPQLWDLLGQVKGPIPSPFFVRNVVRAVRNQSGTRQGLGAWFTRRRLVPVLSATAVIALTAFTFEVLHHQHAAARRGFASTEVKDAELVADLDVLVNDDDSDDALLL
jgi:hypothetical protein